MKLIKKLVFFLIAICLFISNCDQSTESEQLNPEYKIVFVSDRDGYNQIYCINTQDNQQQRLTNDSTDYYYPQFSPDGSKIIYYSHTEGNDEIFIMDANGNNKKNLTNTNGNDNISLFSPDGSKIIFTSDRDKNREIYIMDSDGNNQQRLTNNTMIDHSPTFSTDGSKILFYTIVGNENNPECDIYDIYTINSDGTNLQLLTGNESYTQRILFGSDYYTLEAYAVAPRFSPDGSKIVFCSYDFYTGFDIYMMDSNGQNHVRLTSSGQPNVAPYFTPDGNRIIFRTHRGTGWEIYIMNMDGSNQLNLTSVHNHAYFSQFIPESNLILYNDNLVDYPYKYKIFTVDLSGNNRQQIANHNVYHDKFPNLILNK